MKRPYKRRTRLIKPRRQLKLVGTFLCLSAMSLVIQLYLVSEGLTAAAAGMPEGGAQLMSILPGVLARSLLIALAVALPITFGIGVITTFRLVGPAHKIELYLQALVRGEEPGPCSLRAEDEFHEIAELLNEVLRKGDAPGDAGEDRDEPPLRAAG